MAVSSSVLVTSQKKNRYFFDKNIKKLTLCHPVFYRLIEMDQQGEDLAGWVQQLGSLPLSMEGIGSVTTEEINYYYKKYLLFKENNCFSERDLETKKSARLRPEDVETILANVDQIVFEITDKCNLKCEYCAYGRFYDNFAPRKNSNMDPEVARRVLDYSLGQIKSVRNDSHGHLLNIGFYGGEPLLNFTLIREVVDYLDRVDLSGITVKFSMTTNGLLLEKHMDFLVEHKFSLLISLDGDEKSNSYRVYPNGDSAFLEIFRNVKALQVKYPEYFKTNIGFNAVLHDRNSINETTDFIKKEFDISPMHSGLSESGIREEAKAEFNKIYKIVSENLKNCRESMLHDREKLFQLSEIIELMGFLRHQNSFAFMNFNQLLNDESKVREFCTGTCLPFQKKIYVKVDGRIYPCERIGEFPMLGRVSSTGVDIDSNNVAQLFNAWHNQVKQQCVSCYHADGCPICMFNINDFPEVKDCQWHAEYSGFSRTVAEYLDTLEKKPHLYSEILSEI